MLCVRAHGAVNESLEHVNEHRLGAWGGATLDPPTLHLLGGSTLHPLITTQRPPSLHPPHS